MKRFNKNVLAACTVCASITWSITTTTALAGESKGHYKSIYNPNTPSLTVVNTISDVSGHVAGFVDANGDVNGDMYNPANVSILYPISGDVYATVTDDDAGETQGGYEQIGNISATASFSTSFFGLFGDWSSLPSTLPWTMTNDFAMTISGTTFRFKEELTGRAFPHLGPVENPMDTGTMALRMSGCAGIRADDLGEYAGKVGTLCLNGTFTFDGQFNGQGVSNCSIAIHDSIL